MVVIETPRETQENVDINSIGEVFFDSMNKFYGQNELSWINCLFEYNLKGELNIKKGMIHYFHGLGIDKVQSCLNGKGVYGTYGNPKAVFYTKKLQEEFNLFMIGPEHNNKTLSIVCSSPKISLRDFEEEVVMGEINSNIEKLIQGKHKNVKGKIKLDGPPTRPLERVILYKTWEMPVNPCFHFREDIEDIKTFSQIYTAFFNYQLKRDEGFGNFAKQIIGEGLDKKRD